MNSALLKSIPCKIKFDIGTTSFTQGNKLIKCGRVFRDKLCYFTNVTAVKSTPQITNFLDLLMYITNDLMISREDYKKFFENNLDKAGDYLKTITHKSRVIKFQIMDVLEDRALLCDYTNCMKFYSNLIKMNITMIADNTYAKLDNDYPKTITIFYNKGAFDFGINKSVDVSSMKRYLSEKLLGELKLDELKEYAKLYRVNTIDKKKSDLIQELKLLITTDK